MYKPVIEIKEYKGYIIIKLIRTSINMRIAGVGTLLSNININDIGISNEAYKLLNTHIEKPQHNNPALEFISPTKIWWASKEGLIIDDKTPINIYAIPNKSICDNEIDKTIKKFIDYEKTNKTNN